MVGLRVSKKDTGHYCYDLLLLLLLLLLVYYFFYYYSRITHVCQTNKKDIPIQQKVPLLQKFHRWWLLDVQRDSLPQRCSKYGRFKSGSIFHMDQIPLPFVLRSDKSLNVKGFPCFINGPKGASLSKIQATLQLCVRAEGEQIVRLAIIFHHTGQQLSEEEKNCYHAISHLVRVYFQESFCFII